MTRKRLFNGPLVYVRGHYSKLNRRSELGPLFKYDDDGDGDDNDDEDYDDYKLLL